MEPQELISTIPLIEEFRQSAIWVDILVLLTERIELVRDSLEAELNVEAIRVKQGELQALRSILSLPDTLTQAVEIQTEVNQQETTK